MPVNITQKELMTDEIKMNPSKNQLYANTQLQPLAEHLFEVGYVAKQLFKNTIHNNEKKNLEDIAFLAGCLHDLGKLDPNFQDWARKQKQKDIDDDGQHIDAAKFSFDK